MGVVPAGASAGRASKKRKRAGGSSRHSGAAGVRYTEAMAKLHAELMQDHKAELEDLAGLEWGLHDTQVGLCFHFKYRGVGS